tara:strand:+ start:483 stop:644 length:162 start_codon:yes stop_codon:yes gene_type:complete
MSVSGLTCGNCGAGLVPGSVVKDDGTVVATSECPDGCGRIKSPMCCGNDMHAH